MKVIKLFEGGKWYTDGTRTVKVYSEDRFIEVHGNWTHGGRPYIEGDPECEAQLAYWKERAETSDYYKNAIYTWTNLDVRKVKIAEQNGIRLDIIYYNY